MILKEKIKQILKKKWEIPHAEDFSKILNNLGLTEKVFLYSIIVVFFLSGLILLGKANDLLMVSVPTNGGYLKEGIIGSPRFVNPVLAVSDVDKDLTSLVYSGLMRQLKDGNLNNDLALNYEISDDGLEYTFTLKDDIFFHDGEKITADDVEFTIKTIQDPSIRSPKRPNFYDVKVEKLSDNKIVFSLKKPYSPFLENLTIGIIPKHIWKNLDTDQFALSQYNVEPVGSGPYKVTKMETLKKNMLLIPTYYELTSFRKYSPERPFITRMIFNFYRDEDILIDAYNKREIESINSISPEKISKIKLHEESEIITVSLPRIFAVFFNQNQSEVFANKEVRTAFDILVNRKKIVDDVLYGYGKPLFGPIPLDLLHNGKKYIDSDIMTASSTLSRAGWKINPQTGILEKKISKNKTLELAFSISTLNSPDLVKTAEIIKEDWKKLGAKVDIRQFELGDLQQNVIRPRKFDSLLYGQVIGRDMDLYAFWHSSQRNDPGLNVAMYANSIADKLLDDARKIQDRDLRIEKFKLFEDEINKDIPAVFLYVPEFIYITPKKVKNNELDIITLPYERFADINNWYIEINKLWKIFQ